MKTKKKGFTEDERMRIMLDALPLCCNFWDEDFNNIDCNQEAANLFELSSKEEYLERFFDLSPEYQPDGRLSSEKALEMITTAFDSGRIVFEWMHQKLDGTPVPSEITLVRVDTGEGERVVVGYTRDLREQKNSAAKLDYLKTLAFNDSLTGAYNRRYFNQVVSSEFSMYKQSDSPFAIVLYDLDHFKKVNDTYGHEAGDEILKEVTLTAQTALRASDLLARFGGEEFIILVRNLDQETLLKLTARLRDKIAHSIFSYRNHIIPVTISIGMAMKTPQTESLEELIRHADKALFRAKNNGRNRVELF